LPRACHKRATGSRHVRPPANGKRASGNRIAACLGHFGYFALPWKNGT